MSLFNIAWLTYNCLIVAAFNLLYTNITRYIETKPLGFQSLYDVILCDHIWVARFAGELIFAFVFDTIFFTVFVSAAIDYEHVTKKLDF